MRPFAGIPLGSAVGCVWAALQAARAGSRALGAKEEAEARGGAAEEENVAAGRGWEGNGQEARPEKAGTRALGEARGWWHRCLCQRRRTENLRVALSALSPNRLSYIAIAASMSSRC